MRFFSETDLAALTVLRTHLRVSLPQAMSAGIPVTPTLMMYKAVPDGNLMEMPVPMKAGVKKPEMKTTIEAFLKAASPDAYAFVEAMWTVPGLSAPEMQQIAMYRMSGGKLKDWPGAEERVFVLFQGRGGSKVMFATVNRVPGGQVSTSEPEDVEDGLDIVRFGAGASVAEMCGLGGIGG